MKGVLKGLLKWMADNPQSSAVALMALLAGTKGVNRTIRSIGRCISARQDQYNRDRYVYDHSLGIYVKTNRKLTKADLIRIEQLRSRGLTKTQAMVKLGIL